MEIRVVNREPQLWAVYLEPGELEIRAGEYYPYGGLIGFINGRGTLRISRPAGGRVPRNWSQLARYKLEDARNRLYREGKLRNRPEEKRRAREEREGSFIVKLSDGRQSRFHSMRREAGYQMHGSMASGGALDWAEMQLRLPDVRWAEFWREGQSRPFSVLEKDAYGHVKQGRIDVERDPRRRSARRRSRGGR